MSGGGGEGMKGVKRRVRRSDGDKGMRGKKRRRWGLHYLMEQMAIRPSSSHFTLPRPTSTHTNTLPHAQTRNQVLNDWQFHSEATHS